MPMTSCDVHWTNKRLPKNASFCSTYLSPQRHHRHWVHWGWSCPQVKWTFLSFGDNELSVGNYDLRPFDSERLTRFPPTKIWLSVCHVALCLTITQAGYLRFYQVLQSWKAVLSLSATTTYESFHLTVVENDSKSLILSLCRRAKRAYCRRPRK